MNSMQLTKRQERAANEPLVIQRGEDGFRVYAASEPKNVYIAAVFNAPIAAPAFTTPVARKSQRGNKSARRGT